MNNSTHRPRQSLAIGTSALHTTTTIHSTFNPTIYLVSLICTDESMTVTLNTEEAFEGKVKIFS